MPICDDAAEDSAHRNLVLGWQAKHAALWGHVPICLEHRLHASALFSRAGLAQLIERFPRRHYSIIHMGEQGGDKRFWREGEFGGMTGDEIIDVIENGRLWLNLRHVDEVDRRYARIVELLFRELEALAPGFSAAGRGCGIIISSPNAQVYYHADLPGHGLLQIIGSKRVYFYPPHPPFVGPADLERIAVFGLEVDLPYQDWYDDHARLFDFRPGQMIFWPHTAPHRIENDDCLSVSVTLDFVTPEIRRKQMVILANGILRHRFGLRPRSNATHGPGFWAKSLLQKGLRNTAWMKRRRAPGRAIQFRLDPAAPEGVSAQPETG
jgi:hypothetical protein